MKSAPLVSVGRPDWAKPKPVTGDAPLPLSREIDPPTPFPVDALGPIGADVVKAMQTVIQAPVALLGQTILAAMNQVAQPHANVVVDGRVSPLSEFFLTLGESGERKSAGDSWALAPVRARQRLLMQQYASEREQYEMAAQLFEAQAKRILGDKKLSAEARQAKARAAKGRYDTGHELPWGNAGSRMAATIARRRNRGRGQRTISVLLSGAA